MQTYGACVHTVHLIYGPKKCTIEICTRAYTRNRYPYDQACHHTHTRTHAIVSTSALVRARARIDIHNDTCINKRFRVSRYLSEFERLWNKFSGNHPTFESKNVGRGGDHDL